ncbi:HD domain-containing protein [Macrococcus hajekii]|uniref:HD domain-containing protein n=1 Tax=Macrococcus hajekii TaxID=198482 RepID=A0A4R6BHN0_9STAP|nr:HD domain-containing protein [Macrococcus hajekii]TDM01083.1 HD domain-containing protein [Macrococcus hajekii]GGB12542.1 phosphohydrolase [Macrococcus hajekii]
MIKETEQYVKDFHQGDTSGHDYSHIERVRKMALLLGEQEGADLFIVEMAALLHDTVDDKLTDEVTAWSKLENFFEKIELNVEQREAIKHILKYMSFKGGKNISKLESIEGKVVQDADRLDAIGAIGIARTFMFAGRFGDMMYNPAIPPRDLETADYREKTHAINHFYEKLFKLKDLMNTESGKKIAADRHRFMEQFIDQFKTEWHS